MTSDPSRLTLCVNTSVSPLHPPSAPVSCCDIRLPLFFYLVTTLLPLFTTIISLLLHWSGADTYFCGQAKWSKTRRLFPSQNINLESEGEPRS